MVGRWTCDQQVASSTACRRALGCVPGQVVLTQCASVTKQYNLVPVQAGKVTVGLASHWPCVADNSASTGWKGRRAARLRSTRSSATLFYFRQFILLIESDNYPNIISILQLHTF